MHQLSINMHPKKLKTILIFLALLFVLYFLYLSTNSNNRNTGISTLKPWPNLPSYLPWTENHYIPFRSCEAYFGNGFKERVDVLKPSRSHEEFVISRDEEEGGGGWFSCFYSETLRSSVCEAGKIRMNLDKILMSRGGERLRNVMGRGENVELPVFKDGAFDIEVMSKSRIGKKLADQAFLDTYVQKGAVVRHTMRSLVDSIRLVGSDEFQCSEWIDEPTLLITRFEYANIFHTFTDWYSAYVASRVTGLPGRPHVVFVDGHCEAPLEEMWNALFSSVRYAKHFTSPVCFRHAIFTPLGYETAMFLGLTERINCSGVTSEQLQRHPSNQKTSRLTEFGEMIQAAFEIPIEKQHNPSVHNILFIRREYYLPHPRFKGKSVSRITNEEKVFHAVQVWASKYTDCKLNVVNGLFAHMPMKDQVQAIQNARVIIGTHGAGLAHIVSALSDAVVLEIRPGDFKRPHFGLIAQWKGLEYHSIDLRGSYANPRRVVKKLNEVVRSLGC